MSWKNVNFHDKVAHCLAPHTINVQDLLLLFLCRWKMFSRNLFLYLGCSAYFNKSFNVFLLKKDFNFKKCHFFWIIEKQR